MSSNYYGLVDPVFRLRDGFRFHGIIHGASRLPTLPNFANIGLNISSMVRDSFDFPGLAREGTHLALSHLHMLVTTSYDGRTSPTDLHLHYINRGDYDRTIGHFLDRIVELRHANPVIDAAYHKCSKETKKDFWALYYDDPIAPLVQTFEDKQYHRMRHHVRPGIVAAHNLASLIINILRDGKIGSAAERAGTAGLLIDCGYSPTPRAWLAQQPTNLRAIAGLANENMPDQSLVSFSP